MNNRKEENSARNANGESFGVVKKAVNRKPPVIKQTLTSMYRIAKANPLLYLKDDNTRENTNDFGLSNIRLPKSVLLPSSTSNLTDADKLSSREQSITSLSKPTGTKPAVSTNNQKIGSKYVPLTRTTSLRFKENNKPVSNKVLLHRTGSIKVVPSKVIDNGNSQNFATRTVRTTTTTRTTKVATVTSKTEFVKPVNVKTHKRRSLSAEHYDRKRKLSKPKIEQIIEMKEITQSLNDIEKESTLTAPLVSPIPEEKKVVRFKTPSAYMRRSVSYFTPTPSSSRQCLSFASTPGPVLNDLQSRLEDWLRKHRKPIHSYHHLKCFGLNHNQEVKHDDENKENVEVVTRNSDSYEDLKITPKTSNYINNNTPLVKEARSSYEELQTVARAALNDLHKLILDGYSRGQCEAWLGLIRHKYRYLEEEPQYWECRAAIEQSRGNITSAVECLRTAIVQGAEVKAVDHSLEQLLQKFSLLDISTSESSLSDEGKRKKDRARIVLDARNVFKSSIIQFAVQERTLRKKRLETEKLEMKYDVTPVRRSTRKSRSKYSVTPGVQLCASLQELDDSVRQQINFHGNIALSAGYSNK